MAVARPEHVALITGLSAVATAAVNAAMGNAWVALIAAVAGGFAMGVGFIQIVAFTD